MSMSAPVFKLYRNSPTGTVEARYSTRATATNVARRTIFHVIGRTLTKEHAVYQREGGRQLPPMAAGCGFPGKSGTSHAKTPVRRHSVPLPTLARTGLPLLA